MTEPHHSSDILRERIRERLYNLLDECGHLDAYYLEANDPQLEAKLLQRMEQTWANLEQVGQEIKRTVPTYLRKMSDMGQAFRSLVEKSFPAYAIPVAPKDWRDYLPVLDPTLGESLR